MKKFFLILILTATIPNLKSMEPPMAAQDSEPVKTQDQWMDQGYNALDDRNTDLLEQALQHLVDEQSKYKLLFSALQRWNDDRELIKKLSGYFKYLADSDLRQGIFEAANVVIGCGLDTLHQATSPRRARRPLPRRPSSVRFGEVEAVEDEPDEEVGAASMEEPLDRIQSPVLLRITREAVAKHTPPNSVKGKIYPRVRKSTP